MANPLDGVAFRVFKQGCHTGQARASVFDVDFNLDQLMLIEHFVELFEKSGGHPFRADMEDCFERMGLPTEKTDLGGC